LYLETLLKYIFLNNYITLAAFNTKDYYLNLLGMTCAELEQFITTWSEHTFHGRQIYQWIYKKRVYDFEQMTDLNRNLRRNLIEKAYIYLPRIIIDEVASDNTRKLLFEMEDGERIESVIIPEGERFTACLSSQIGCLVGCKFCATGQIGFKRNLTAGEIVGQMMALEQTCDCRMTNIVLMGMGEPLMNLKAVFKAVQLITDPDGIELPRRKMIISTVGWLPGIRAMIDEGLKVKLAISLNTTTDKQRHRLMPLMAKYSIKEIISSAREYSHSSGLPVSIGYLLINNENDSLEDAHRLARLIGRLSSKVNLMEYNEIGKSYKKTDPIRIEIFRNVLQKKGITVTLRSGRGENINAACGQLAAGYENIAN